MPRIQIAPQRPAVMARSSKHVYKGNSANREWTVDLNKKLQISFMGRKHGTGVAQSLGFYAVGVNSQNKPAQSLVPPWTLSL